MKRLIFVVTGVLLIMSVLSTGCATKTVAPAPPTPPPPQTVTGTLTDINPSPEPGKSTVTVKTPQGEATYRIAANATFGLEGQVCTLDQIEGLELAKQSYNCTIVMGIDEAGNDAAVALNVTKIFP